MSELSEYTLSPSQFAKKVGVSAPTVRRWEKDGVISSVRNGAGHRRYSHNDIVAACAYKERQEQERSLRSKENIYYTSPKPKQDSSGDEAAATPSGNSSKDNKDQSTGVRRKKSVSTQKTGVPLSAVRIPRPTPPASTLQSQYPTNGTNRRRISPILVILLVLFLAGGVYGIWSLGLTGVLNEPLQKVRAIAGNLLPKSPYQQFKERPLAKNIISGDESAEVLAEQTGRGFFRINLPSEFTEEALFEEIIVQDESTFLANINAQGQVLDLSDGEIIAPNVIYEVIAGDGIIISEGQRPVISADAVASFQGQTGNIELVAGDGLSIDGLTVTNDDRGSAQNIFKNVFAGGSTISASSNNDTLRLTAGDNVSISSNPNNNEVTISSTAGDSGWTDTGDVVQLANLNDQVAIGRTTASYTLDIEGTFGVSGNTTFGGNINLGNASVLQQSSGTITLANIDSLDAKTEATFESSIDSLPNLTAAPSLQTVGTITTGSWQGSAITEVYGGTGITNYSVGDLLYAQGLNDLAALPVGSDDQVLTVVGGVPVWNDVNSGLSAVEEGDVQVNAGTVSVLDFLGGDFDLTETPSEEINIALAATLSSVTGVAGNFDAAGTLTAGTGNAFQVDANGSITIPVTETLTIGTTDLNETNSGDSGAGLIGVYTGGFANASPSTDDLQTVLESIDQAIGSGSSKWTASGGILYPNNYATLDFAIGGTSATSSPFGVDEDSNIVYIGDGSDDVNDPTLYFQASDASTSGSIIFRDSGLFEFTANSIDADSIALSAGGGLTTVSDQLSLLSTCSGGQVLKWNSGSSAWECANDTGASSAVINVENNDVSVGSNVDTLDFESVFTLTTEGGGTEANIDITDDALNFTEIADALALDDTTTITTGGSDFIVNLSSTTEGFIIHDNGTAFATFNNDGTFDLDNLTFDGSTITRDSGSLTISTTTSGDIILNPAGDVQVANGDLIIGAIGLSDQGVSSVTSGASLIGVYSTALSNSSSSTLQAVLEDLDSAITGSGDITTVGDVSSGAAFATGSGQGTSLYFYDADGEGLLTIADLTIDRTYILPNASGEISLLGQAIDLSSEVESTLGAGNGGTGDDTSATTGVPYISSGDWLYELQLSVARGGTGASSLTDGGILLGSGTGAVTVTSRPTAGQLLIGNTTGDPTLAQLTQGTGITITNGSGSISIANALGDSIEGSEITDNTIEEIDLEADAPTDNYLLSYDQASGGFSWVDPSTAGTNYWSRNSVDGFVYPATTTDDLVIGGNATDGSAFFFDVGNHQIVLEGATDDTFETTLAFTDPTADRLITFPNAGGEVSLLGQLIDLTSEIEGTLAADNGGTGDDTSATTGVPYISSGDWLYESQLSVARGGTGASSLTDGGILLGSGTGAVTVTSRPTAGQLLIGNTTGDPTLAQLTQGTGITITNGSGSISIANALGDSIEGSEITDGTIEEIDLEADAPTDNYLLSYDQASGGFSWVDPSTAGTSYWSRNSVDGFVYPATTSDDLVIGGNATDGSAFFFDVGNNQIVLEGATDDTFETTLAFTDPTADRTITFPNAGGEVSLLGQLIDLTSEVENTLGAGNGGTGIDSSSSTGIATVNSGSWTIASQLAPGLGGTGDDTSATTGVPYISSGDWLYESQLSVARGGTGASSLTDGGILLGSGTGAVTVTSRPTAGQLLIGNTTGDPTLAQLTQGTGITITNGSGSISIANALGDSIEGSEITDNTIEEIDLEADAPTDNYILSYDQASGGFSWVDPSTAGTNYWSRNSVDGFVYPATTSDDLVIGGNATDGSAFFFDVGNNQIVLEGATDDTFETTLAFTDPTADRTITFPNAGGEVSLLGQLIDLSSEVESTLAVGNGGTGTSSLTDGGILLGSGTGAVTVTSRPTAGQLLIGNTTGDPTLAQLTQGTGITITNGSGSISIANALGDSIEGSEITDNTIEEIDLEADAPTDNYLLSYDQASGGFSWVDPSTAGTSYWSRNSVDGFVYPATTTDDLVIGGNATDGSAFFFDVGNHQIVLEGATDDTFETTVAFTDPTADRTITFPNAGGEVSLLGQLIDLTSEIEGTLAADNGGTGDDTSATTGIYFIRRLVV